MTGEHLIRCLQAVPCTGDDGYPAPALDCTIAPATLTCLIGPMRRDNSHYMRMLGGVDPACSGQIRFFGEDGAMLSHTQRRLLHRRCGYVSSGAPLLSILNGIDNVKLPALYHRLATPEEVDERAGELLAALDYEADHAVLPAYMTQLQRRHLMLARALILNPEVLFIEAPFYDVDDYSVGLLQEYLLRLVKRGLAIVISSDHLDYVRRYADQIIFIGRNRTYTLSDWDALLTSSDSEIRHYLDRQRDGCGVLE